MASKAYQSQKVSLRFSKKQIEKAGRAIRHGCIGDEREDAILKIQNFRETHLYPLMLIKNHLASTAKRSSKRSVVARRLKMLSTIIDKLERPSLDGNTKNAIQITRMQDIGGCRAIVPDLKALNNLHRNLKKSRSVHEIVRTIDYLKPKESGYSGIHLVYSCFAGSEEQNEWKNTKIEVQLRTELQHAWATSLEIIDTLEGIRLKTSTEGHPKWRKFFKLSGILVAHSENSYEVSEEELSGIKNELISLEEELQVRRKLAQYSFAINVTTDKKRVPRSVMTHQGMFLIKVHKPAHDEEGKYTLNTILLAYGPNDIKVALSDLANAEKDNEILISVLLAAGDARNLKKAYPNYFGSTKKFQDFLSGYIKSETI